MSHLSYSADLLGPHSFFVEQTVKGSEDDDVEFKVICQKGPGDQLHKVISISLYDTIADLYDQVHKTVEHKDVSQIRITCIKDNESRTHSIPFSDPEKRREKLRNWLSTTFKESFEKEGMKIEVRLQNIGGFSC